jgi:SAM-dependent methyltransferase
MPFVAHRALGWRPVEIDETWGLVTIRKGMAFSICNSLWCRTCTLLFLDLRFSQAELAALYADYRGSDYVALREHYEPGYALRNEVYDAGSHYLGAVESFLEPHLPERPRVLDWGGDTGRNTPFAGRRALGHVHDISGKKVLPGIERVDLDAVRRTQYDLVVCSNVLEHVPYPADLVLELRSAMSRGTILYVEVPHEDLRRTHTGGAGELHTKKRHWHEHINFFGLESLHRLLHRCGLEVIAAGEMLAVVEGRTVAIFQFACRLA